MTKVIYVAGKYNDKNHFERRENVNYAARYAKELWKKGWAVICPHKNTNNFEYLNIDVDWVKRDLEIVRRCDAIFMTPTWKDSSGSKKELYVAQENDLDVYFDLNNVPVIEND